MTNPIMRGFRMLGQLSGRDTVGQFWPYAGVIFATVFILCGAGMSWAMQDVFKEIQTFAVQHPEAVTVEASATSYSMSVDAGHPDAPIPDMSKFFAVLGVTVVAAVGLLAAAVSRRLHDCSRPAYLALVPVVFLTIGLCLFPLMMSDVGTSEMPNMGLFFGLFLNNLLYLGSLITLIIQCARHGTRGPNRHGPNPKPGEDD